MKNISRWASLTSSLSSWRALAATIPSTPLRFNWFDLSRILLQPSGICNISLLVKIQATGVFSMEELCEAVHVECWGLEVEEEKKLGEEVQEEKIFGEKEN